VECSVDVKKVSTWDVPSSSLAGAASHVSCSILLEAARYSSTSSAGLGVWYE
jgi:hypothetical protein